jgi:hypothetical protein
VRPSRDGHFPRLLPGVIRNFYGRVSLGNGTAWQFGAFKTMSGIFVGIVGHGAALFTRPIMPIDAAADLNIYEMGDAANVADLINDQFDGERRPRFGRYTPELCNETGERPDEY